jgi:hypothetical protein
MTLHKLLLLLLLLLMLHMRPLLLSKLLLLSMQLRCVIGSPLPHNATTYEAIKCCQCVHVMC